MSEALQRLSKKHLDRARGLLPSALPGSAKGLGGPIELPAAGEMPHMPRPAVPMDIGAGYSNQYGTNLYVGGDPLQGTVNAHGTIPIGDARRGLTLQGRAGYGPDQGLSGFIGVSKRNLPQDLEHAGQVLGIDQPGGEKYSFGVSLNDPRYSGNPAFGGQAPMLPQEGGPAMGPPQRRPPPPQLYTTLPDVGTGYGSVFSQPRRADSFSPY
jgi:hypothetical protein